MLQTGTKTVSPVDRTTAVSIFDKLIKSKLAKGYTPGEDGTPYAGTDTEPRDGGILPQLPCAVEEGAGLENLRPRRGPDCRRSGHTKRTGGVDEEIMSKCSVAESRGMAERKGLARCARPSGLTPAACPIYTSLRQTLCSDSNPFSPYRRCTALHFWRGHKWRRGRDSNLISVLLILHLISLYSTNQHLTEKPN